MSSCVLYPGTGCIVEFLEGNAVHLALVIEEGGGKVRLLLPNRRETRLGTSRLLPWAGPQAAACDPGSGCDFCLYSLKPRHIRYGEGPYIFVNSLNHAAERLSRPDFHKGIHAVRQHGLHALLPFYGRINLTL